jgi:hypothetical protein
MPAGELGGFMRIAAKGDHTDRESTRFHRDSDASPGSRGGTAHCGRQMEVPEEDLPIGKPKSIERAIRQDHEPT